MQNPSANTGADSDAAAAPENWSPEQETALLLDLCEAQMEAAMRDSDQSVDALVKAFTQLVEASAAMGALAKQLPSDLSTGQAAVDLKNRCNNITAQINEAIVAFQFYDKLTQRLGHVRHSLTTLALFVCDRTHAQQREHWRKLLTTLRRLYRTAEEREVFELVAEGATADEVRKAMQHTPPINAAQSSIELF